MSELIEIKVDDPGDTEEVEVIEVMVEAGQSVAKDDVLLEIATDKANMEIQAPVDGVVEQLRVAEGDIVAADTVFALLRP